MSEETNTYHGAKHKQTLEDSEAQVKQRWLTQEESGDHQQVLATDKTSPLEAEQEARNKAAGG